jgi:hypothetical protein
MAKTICAAPGCPNVALGPHTNRGYCDDHATAAIVDVLEDIAGYLDQLVRQADRLRGHLAERDE